MKLLKGDVLSINNQDYIVIECLNYNYETYIFTNQLINEEEVSENHYIFKITNDNAIVITDENLINILLDKFKDLINQDLNYFLDKNIGSDNNGY